MKKLINWCKQNISGMSLLFFLAFIPLYPKLPIINVIRTWVYIRLEDFLVAGAVGIYILARLRQRRIPKTPLTWPIIIYWGVGIMSAIFSIVFIGPHLEGYFPHLVALHFLRRVEYMMLFFMAFDVVARKKSLVTAIIWTLAGTVFLIIVYGFGQKFLGWPAFLTMNEEFAKGIPLRLPPTARIPSTFGGHYDLAAYIVLTLPILASFIFAAKKIWQKIIFFVLSTGSLIMLLFTASRTSFLVYLVAISMTLFWYKKKWFIIPVIILSFVFLNFVSGASDRFYKTFRFSDVIVDLSTGKPVGTLEKLEGGKAVIQKSASPASESLPTGSQYINVPSSTQQAQAPNKQVKTIEVYNSIDLATGSGEIATISGSFLIQKAFVYDISITTRLQGEWPNALVAFKRNILLGSGFSTLSVAADGDYIRMLGETGVLGTLSFLGILFTAYALFFKRKEVLVGYEKAFVIGVFGGLTGLLFNAILIDVFEASKVAFVLWLLLGIAMALCTNVEVTLRDYLKLLWHILTHNIAYFIYLFVGVIVLYGGAISHYFVGDDFTWLKWAASTSASTIYTFFTNAQGFFYRPIPKLWYFGLYALFWLKPEGYHVMSFLLLTISSFLVFLLMTVTGVKRWIALVLSLLFVTLSIHHENIFWISGQSSLLASVFLYGSVFFLLTHVQHRALRRTIHYAAAVILMVLSMFSYDGMVVVPIIFSLIMWSLVGKKHWATWAPLLAIPVYWYIRSATGAVPPSGDYGYKLSALPFNVLGNSIGYIVSTFFGPKVIESWGTLRDYLRMHRLLASGVGVGLVGISSFIVWKKRFAFTKYHQALVWFFCGMVALGAYVGLGNMAERYAFIASGFFIMALGAYISTYWNSGRHVLGKTMICITIVGLCIWNVSEVNRLGADWKKASDISQRTLLTLSHLFFPLNEKKNFIFINLPIRYGRAWIFPTGTDDALWHIFRFNPQGFVTTNVATREQAYTLPVISGINHELFIFDKDFTMKRLVKQIKVVEVDK